jgi:hypothetical protein
MTSVFPANLEDEFEKMLGWCQPAKPDQAPKQSFSTFRLLSSREGIVVSKSDKGAWIMRSRIPEGHKASICPYPCTRLCGIDVYFIAALSQKSETTGEGDVFYMIC